MKSIVNKYRKAAQKLWGISKVEAETYILDPKDDAGENAPNALVVIYLEADCRKKGDEGTLPALLSSYEMYGIENCIKLAKETGTGTYVEYNNAAVAAVWRI